MSSTAPRPPRRSDRVDAPVREERVVVEDDRRNPLASFLGGTLKAVVWMIVGVVVAVAIILALLF